MEAMRAVLVCAVVLCSAVVAEFVNEKLNRNQTEKGSIIYHDSYRRMSHRVQLLFPLLLRISSRLATLISTALMSLAGIFLFVAFSKKAFIVSLLALFLTYLDKKGQGQRDEDIVHMYRIKDMQQLGHNEEHFHYKWTYPKLHHHSGSYNKYVYMSNQFPNRRPHRTKYHMRSFYKVQPSFLTSWVYTFESPSTGNNQTVSTDQIDAEV